MRRLTDRLWAAKLTETIKLECRNHAPLDRKVIGHEVDEYLELERRNSEPFDRQVEDRK
jgi:hypothetical protein